MSVFSKSPRTSCRLQLVSSCRSIWLTARSKLSLLRTCPATRLTETSAKVFPFPSFSTLATIAAIVEHKFSLRRNLQWPKRKKLQQPPASTTSTTMFARRADKEKIHINVAETKRVLACFFDVLENQKPAVAFDVIAKGLKRAGTRRR